MCASYSPPLEYLPEFNSSDFISYMTSLSLEQANTLYARLANSNIYSGLNNFSGGLVSQNATINDFLTVIGQASFSKTIQLPTLGSNYGTIPSSALGYNTSSTNTTFTMSSGIYTNTKSLLLPIGVWLVYYEFNLVVTTGGNVSLIQTGACTTAGTNSFIAYTGMRRIHTPSNYTTNDTETWSSTYISTQTVSTNLVFLTAYMVFASGAYTITSKNRLVRIG